MDPILPSSISELEVDDFIEKMIEFFVVSPTQLDPPMFGKLRYLISQKDKRYKQLIKDFLPVISAEKLATISSLIRVTSSLNDILKDIRHNLILGKKIKSSFHIQQTASKISQSMKQAQAYRIALDTFRSETPIGDSIGPITIRSFIKDQSKNSKKVFSQFREWKQDFISYNMDYKGRKCICLRAKGPTSNVGNPGTALQGVIRKFEKNQKNIDLIITIDAYKKLEGEPSGLISQGIGVSVGGEGKYFLDKYQIETIALTHKPKIQIESINCKESLSDAVSPMKEQINASLPDILRILKKIIRSQTKENEHVAIIGVGNALGVRNGP